MLISCSVVVPQSSLGSGGHYVIDAITAEARDEVGQIIENRKRMQSGGGRGRGEKQFGVNFDKVLVVAMTLLPLLLLLLLSLLLFYSCFHLAANHLQQRNRKGKAKSKPQTQRESETKAGKWKMEFLTWPKIICLLIRRKTNVKQQHSNNSRGKQLERQQVLLSLGD